MDSLLDFYLRIKIKTKTITSVQQHQTVSPQYGGSRESDGTVEHLLLMMTVEHLLLMMQDCRKALE